MIVDVTSRLPPCVNAVAAAFVLAATDMHSLAAESPPDPLRNFEIRRRDRRLLIHHASALGRKLKGGHL